MKIPPQAELKFKGILFDIFQWPQTMYDGSVRTFEMLNRQPTVDIIATVGDKIIVLEQEQPTKPLFPSLPGGGIEGDSDPVSEAKRELMEETGYAAESYTLLKEFEGSSKMYFHEYLFVAKNCRQKGNQKLDGGEKIRLSLRSFDEFLSLCRQDNFSSPIGLKFMMYEALLDKSTYDKLHEQIFSS